MAETEETLTFTDELRTLKTTDKAHADTFNPLFKSLLENDLYLKALLGLLTGELQENIVDKLNEIKVLLGDSSDPNALTMAEQLTDIINKLTAYGNKFDAFRAVYTDKRGINLDKLDVAVSSRASASILGATADGGGTASAGTAMAKLNALINLVNYVSGQQGKMTDAGAWTGGAVGENLHQKCADLLNLVGSSGAQGGLTGQVYNENLHQKCADILWYAIMAKSNIDTIMTKGSPGDYVGKVLNMQALTVQARQTWTLSHAKGGLVILQANESSYNHDWHTLIVDGVTYYTAKKPANIWEHISIGSNSGLYELIVPFSSYVQIISTEDPPVSSSYTVGVILKALAYLNP